MSASLSPKADRTKAESSRFSDVSLLCERTGMTNLPLSNYKPGRSDSMPEMSGKSRNNTTGRRTHSIKARNLYRVSGCRL